MLTVYNAMLVILGFLLAALLVLFILPAYRRRIDRFTTERLKRALPLTEAEIRADKDRIRAEFATEVHKLEMKLDEASVSAARQSVEINRREARIHDLEQAIEAQKASVEENENARRVLEQAIIDRLPKVEQRLSEARRMLQKRDEEIALLADTSGKQTEALEQATQINVQLNSEVGRLKAALETRAARNREAIGDPRFDGEVALRSEIEALRAKSREQSELIDRLQAKDGAKVSADEAGALKADRLAAQLAETEAELMSLKAGAVSKDGDAERLRQLEAENADLQSEIVKLRAALATHEQAGAQHAEAHDRVTAEAEISSLKATAENQNRTIQMLKSEIAASNERLSRQAQHFRDEMRRLSSPEHAGDTNERRSRSIEAARRSLAKRISEPRVPAATEVANEEATATAASASADAPRSTPYLMAISGGAGEHAADAPADGDAPAPPAVEVKPARRTRLLDRISSIDKQQG